MTSLCSRRMFFKMTLLVSGTLAFDVRSALAWISAPPSIMLHARQEHLDNLPTLLDWLLDQGFTPVTYRAVLDALTGGDPLPLQPVVISIDDLTLVRGSRNFPFIERMVELFVVRSLPVVLSVNTEPVYQAADGTLVRASDQDDDYWKRAAGWTAHDIELATHTQSHQNLTDMSLTPDDYRREIGGSAHMIHERTGTTVTTLVLPFGNCSVDGRHDGPLFAPIEAACRAAGIRMAIGIARGRGTLRPAAPGDAPVYVLGRVGPLAGNFDSIYWDVADWQRTNAAATDEVAIP